MRWDCCKPYAHQKKQHYLINHEAHEDHEEKRYKWFGKQSQGYGSWFS